MNDAPQSESADDAAPLRSADKVKPRTGLWVALGALGLALVAAAIAIPVSIANAQAAEQEAAARAERDRLSTFLGSLNDCKMYLGDTIKILDGGEAINLSRVSKYDGATLDELSCFLGEISAPESVESKIAATRALDGVQTDSWDGFEIEWRYHPDNGATILIEHSK